MCTDEQNKAITDRLDTIASWLGRDPFDTVLLINDNLPWTVDYRGYKHIFFWIPGAALTFVMGDYGTGVVQAQTWTNLGVRPGTKIMTSGQTTSVAIVLRFTNEVVP